VERKFNILIVDKQYDPGRIFKEMLDKSGYHTVSLSAYPEIVDLLAQKRVDLVIVGIAATIEICESIIRQIKEMHLNAPVIAVSSRQDIQGKELLIERGLKEWISQPFDMKYVKQRVDELLRAK
jgi:DNA-binding response OmpR family regulator